MNEANVIASLECALDENGLPDAASQEAVKLLRANAARVRELEALVEKMPVAIIEPGEAGLFHATSPDIPGLFVSGESVAEVRAAIPVVARALLARMGGEHDRS